jgi:hypothetical protein
MASTGKRKTTMAKLARESRLRERRLDKQARKDARKHAAAHPESQPGQLEAGDEHSASDFPIGDAEGSPAIRPSRLAPEPGASPHTRG